MPSGRYTWARVRTDRPAPSPGRRTTTVSSGSRWATSRRSAPRTVSPCPAGTLGARSREPVDAGADGNPLIDTKGVAVQLVQDGLTFARHDAPRRRGRHHSGNSSRFTGSAADSEARSWPMNGPNPGVGSRPRSVLVTQCSPSHRVSVVASAVGWSSWTRWPAPSIRRSWAPGMSSLRR